ncbi:bifunctional uridylyltransferase/uridylyl-removing protein [Methylophaga nitratireducenticrescens]|uniref:Bifunctional uridylyltransferase/uridylyl-removing enzyme n=1 Tax=Methylophaga nitratireducenticrescens TaxID=754476 RepID=I1XHU5_METNJ|nr:[protein-PII] uridylyltransferase [Methylophaga nitratireducenticrescens]AFI83964.1 bifunctional uridylyltransferase/uridylyl-removing protein [Methylophaga nitratireducenticrescens]
MVIAAQSVWEFGQADNATGCRDILAKASQHLKKCFFEDQADIDWLVHQQAHFVDEVLQLLWQKHLATEATLSLIAVGGYGRGELHPHSDIDLLVLLNDSIAETPPPALSTFLTQLWDIGLEIGHSVRTISECRQLAEDDITIATNLLEARFLFGNQALFEQLQQLTVSTKTWDNQLFYERKKQEQIQRHHKYNDTGNNLEPNLKESPGGLRDIHVITWVAQQHFDVRNLQGLKSKGFLAESEFEILQQSRRFLWRVRFVLHHLAGRKQEKMMIDHQRELAKQLGYVETDSRMAVEHFMKDYYRTVRAVSQMNALLLQLFEENIILADEPRDIEPINRRFQSHNGYLETINSGIFAYYPYALLEVFLILQQHPHIKGIRASTIRQIHAHLHLIDSRFRADIKNRSLFMEIIRQQKGITHEFRRMNQLGVLGAYLPEFGRIVGQMQHDLFHAYTVDEHTLFLLRNLRRFSCPEFNDEFPLCSEVFYQLPKPELLYIAGIYHDIAKGRGGDHSVLGVLDAEQFCTRHNLSDYDTSMVTFLVRHHLAMSSTAQKKDLEDPEVIQDFAALVGSVNRLNYLYLLTVADIRATNNNLWNGWRDSLLKQLYHNTHQWLEHTEAQAKSTQEKSHKKYQLALEKLTKMGWPPQDITTLWHTYDLDYFLRHSVEEIVWQTNGRLENPEQEPLILVRPHSDRHTLELFIYAQNRQALFAAMTASLEQLQLNILDAKININGDDSALNTFIINGAQQRYEDIINAVSKQLANEELISGYKPQLIPRTTKLFKTEPVIKFTTNIQQNHTVMELYTHDRPGLLSAVAQVFLSHQIQVINAKMVTLGDQVEDVFFITNLHDQSLNDSEQSNLLTDLKEQLLL